MNNISNNNVRRERALKFQAVAIRRLTVFARIVLNGEDPFQVGRELNLKRAAVRRDLADASSYYCAMHVTRCRAECKAKGLGDEESDRVIREKVLDVYSSTMYPTITNFVNTVRHPQNKWLLDEYRSEFHNVFLANVGQVL